MTGDSTSKRTMTEQLSPRALPLSVIVITKDEERNIRDCLESVRWVQDLIVVDAESSDRTVDIARSFTSKVFVRTWEGYASTKTFAISQTQFEWVLWLDADERVPFELAEEIRAIVSDPVNDCSGYEVARRTFFLNKWIQHCGWYPGYVVRLFKKSHAQFSSSKVHEKLNVAGRTGRLRHDLFHYTDDTLFHYFSKFNRYTTLAAEDHLEGGKRVSLCDLLVRPPFLFLKMYILRLGILDGVHGLVLSLLSAAYVFVKYAKIREQSCGEHRSYG